MADLISVSLSETDMWHLIDELEGEVMGPFQHLAEMWTMGAPEEMKKCGYVLQTLFEAGQARISKVVKKHFSELEVEE